MRWMCLKAVNPIKHLPASERSEMPPRHRNPTAAFPSSKRHIWQPAIKKERKQTGTSDNADAVHAGQKCNEFCGSNQAGPWDSVWRALLSQHNKFYIKPKRLTSNTYLPFFKYDNSRGSSTDTARVLLMFLSVVSNAVNSLKIHAHFWESAAVSVNGDVTGMFLKQLRPLPCQQEENVFIRNL